MYSFFTRDLQLTLYQRWINTYNVEHSSYRSSSLFSDWCESRINAYSEEEEADVLTYVKSSQSSKLSYVGYRLGFNALFLIVSCRVNRIKKAANLKDIVNWATTHENTIQRLRYQLFFFSSDFSGCVVLKIVWHWHLSSMKRVCEEPATSCLGEYSKSFAIVSFTGML